MADPTPEERRKELAETFADGLELFENRVAERKAKEEASKPPEDKGGGDNDNTGGKSFAERLLGF